MRNGLEFYNFADWPEKKRDREVNELQHDIIDPN